MRSTLHDYVIELANEYRSDFDYAFRCALSFVKLTNRAPKLGDFVPCDEDGNVLKNPKEYLGENDKSMQKDDWAIGKIKQYQQAQSRVIFKGDWKVVHSEYDYAIIRSKEFQFIWKNGKLHYCQDEINRIEDLPREIEFKEGLI